ncbi:hypothetical protein Hanom_Chr01g00004071 [Helianthus anomalus]
MRLMVMVCSRTVRSSAHGTHHLYLQTMHTFGCHFVTVSSLHGVCIYPGVHHHLQSLQYLHPSAGHPFAFPFFALFFPFFLFLLFLSSSCVWFFPPVLHFFSSFFPVSPQFQRPQPVWLKKKTLQSY